MSRASGTAHGANLLITRGLPPGSCCSACWSRSPPAGPSAFRCALVASGWRLAEGDYSYRAPSTSGDELRAI